MKNGITTEHSAAETFPATPPKIPGDPEPTPSDQPPNYPGDPIPEPPSTPPEENPQPKKPILGAINIQRLTKTVGFDTYS